MGIPIKYNLRSMWMRRVGTLMTALGIGLTVSIVVIMLSMVYGLQSAFTETGRDDQLIVVRKGAQNETNSYFNRDLFQTVRFLPGLAQDDKGEPLASGEIVVVINWPRLDGGETNVVMRGMRHVGFALRPEMRIVEGRRFEPGLREIVVSESVANRFEGMQLGQSVEINKSQWKIVGLFESDGSAHDSEIFAAYDDVAQAWLRPIYTSILVRAESGQAFQALRQRIDDDQRIQLQAVPQREYFASQTGTAAPIMTVGTFVAICMGIGACFASMNLMYGTIMARVKEIATLRALGFKRFSILVSFMIEAVLLTLMGGLLGCLMALPMHGITTGTTNFAGSFSEVLFQFRITPFILAAGMIFALSVGIFGGFLPSLRAARIRLIEALR